MEITGKIISIQPSTSGTSKANKPWTKQSFVIETQETYPKKVAIDVMNDKVEQLSHYKVGDTITCGINIDSREYNGRWYTQINAWKLQGTSSNRQEPEPDPFHPDADVNAGDDSLPF
jgi:uncharacterized protein DUF3127